MKLLFVLPNLQIGGVEKVRLALIQNLSSKEIECHLALRRASGELVPQARQITTLHEIAPKGIYQFLPGLTHLINSQSPSHVITAFSDIGFITWLALKLSRSNAQWIHSVHNTHSMEGSRRGFWGRLRYRLENRMGAFCYHHCDHVVTVSNGVRQEVIDLYGVDPKNVSTIYNPVVPDTALQPRHLRWPEPGQAVSIVTIGRLVRQKGFDILIDAMRQVSGDWQLDIWGEGPERPRLQKAIEATGLEKQIRLRGYTPNPLETLQNAHIYVMPSRHEGLGNTLIEAMASQCQLISTDCPHGPREIMKNGSLGQLVPPNDPKALAHALTRIIAGDCRVDEAYLQQRARSFIQANSIENWRSLLTKHHKPSKRNGNIR